MASELIRCRKCEGKKRIRALGGMEKECPECSGIGWLEIEKSVEKPPLFPSRKKGNSKKPTEVQIPLET